MEHYTHFDPFIFISHLAAIFMWSFHVADPKLIFPTLYVLLALYYMWRSLDHYILEKGLYRKDPTYQPGDQYTLIATFNLYVWNVVKRRMDGTYQLGEMRNLKLKWMDTIKCDNHPAIEASKQHEDIKHCSISPPTPALKSKSTAGGYEVRSTDVRYRHRKQYPFVAVLLMDHDFQTLDSYARLVERVPFREKIKGRFILKRPRRGNSNASFFLRGHAEIEKSRRNGFQALYFTLH